MKKVVAFIVCLTLIFSLSVVALAADPQFPLGTAGYISGSNITLRSSAGIASNNAIGLVQNNDKFWYQGYGGYASGYDWYHVYMGSGTWSGTFGYVASDFVKWSR